MFKAATRQGRYIQHQKDLAKKPIVPSANGKLRDEISAIHNAMVFKILSRADGAQKIRELLERENLEHLPTDIDQLLGQLPAVAPVVHPKVAAMINSKGTRWVSVCKILGHMKDKRGTIMSFVANEAKTFGSRVCDSAKELTRLFNESPDACFDLWKTVAIAYSDIEHVYTFVDNLADRREFNIESLDRVFRDTLEKLDGNDNVVDLKRQLLTMYENHPNCAVYSCVRFLHPAFLRVTYNGDDAKLTDIINNFRTTFGPMFGECEGHEYKQWAESGVETMGTATQIWKTQDNFPVIQKFALAALAIVPVVTQVDSGFSSMDVIASNKRRQKHIVTNLSMKCQLYINKDIRNSLEADELTDECSNYATDEEDASGFSD